MERKPGQFSIDTITFPAINLTYGNHSFKVFTSLPNGIADLHNGNDTLSRTIVISNLPLVSSFSTTTSQFCNAPATAAFVNSSQNATTYLWDFGDGTGSTDQNPTHTYSNLGVYSVSLTADGGICGNSLHTITNCITVGATPPTTHDTANCGATSLTLTANGTGSINWYTTASGGSPMFIGNTFTTPILNTTTTYYVENSIIAPLQHVGKIDSVGGGSMHTNNAYYLIFDCLEPVILKTVKVYAGAAGSRTIAVRNSNGQALNPPVTATLSVPAGLSTLTLNFNIPAGTGYQLVCTNSNPNMYRSTGGITYPYLINGLVSITGTNTSVPRYYFFYDWEVQGQSCISARLPLVAAVNFTAPVADFSSLATGLTVNFTDMSTNPFTYKWKFGDGAESTDTNPVYTYTSDGTYTVKQIVYNGCGLDSITKDVTVTSTGINENDKDISVSIYPNPANRQDVTIQISNYPFLGSIEVYTALGSQADVVGTESQSDNTALYHLNTSTLMGGIYFVVINSNHSKVVKKLVVTR